MKIRQFTRAGQKVNEDSCYICKDYGFVIDGATSVTEQNITNFKSEAQWFSYRFRDYLIEALKNKNQTLSEIVRQGIEKLNVEYNNFLGAQNSEIKPSAAIAIFRLNDCKIEYFVLGDCSIIYDDEQEIKVITTTDIEKLDNKSKQTLKNIAVQKNINVIDAKPFVAEVLKQQRRLKNTKEGYWILSDDTNAVNYAECGEMEKTKIKHIVVVSDGFSQVYDLFKIFTVKEFLKELRFVKNISKIYKKLYKNQKNDRFCNNFPRFKVRDDATLIEMLL